MFKRINSETSTEQESSIIKDEANKGMKEIIFDADKHAVKSTNSTVRDMIRNLLDKSKQEAKELLEKMVADKQISEFRLAPIGAALTQDYRPDRVSVTFDATGKVVEAELG
jgi:vacuolar-type H+-ATPase subunit E/Vma4